MEVTIIGSGYVGLTTGVCLADNGHRVTCIDVNDEVVLNINKGKPNIYEPNLEDLLNSVLNKEVFLASTNLNEALDKSEIVLVAVGTPSLEGKIDLRYIEQVAKNIGSWIKRTGRRIPIVIKSTVVPTTTDTYFKEVIEKFSNYKHPHFGLGMNPEFLREGSAVSDFKYPDRIVFGFEDEMTLEALKKLYERYDCPKIFVNSRTAEFIKYTNNSLLALQISFSNEMANLANKIRNIDYNNVLQGVLSDHRWRSNKLTNNTLPGIVKYLEPGCGFGGSCFPKDVEAILNKGKEIGLKMSILNSVLEVNREQPKQIISLLKDEIYELKNRFSTLVLGLSFKPNTNDIRYSPAKFIIDELLENNIKVYAHDPIASSSFQEKFFPDEKNIKFVKEWKNIIENVDVVIIVTTWSEYKDLQNLSRKNHIIVDLRRMLDVTSLNFKSYRSIGYSID